MEFKITVLLSKCVSCFQNNAAGEELAKQYANELIQQGIAFSFTLE